MKLWLTWCKDDKWELWCSRPELGHYENYDYWHNDGATGSSVDRPKSIRGRVTQPTCWVGEAREWGVTK
jgi:hypothetical protein